MISGRLYEWRDQFYRWLAWRLPDRLAFWAFMRGAAICTTGEYAATNPNELGLMEAIDRLEPTKQKGRIPPETPKPTKTISI